MLITIIWWEKKIWLNWIDLFFLPKCLILLIFSNNFKKFLIYIWKKLYLLSWLSLLYINREKKSKFHSFLNGTGKRAYLSFKYHIKQMLMIKSDSQDRWRCGYICIYNHSSCLLDDSIKVIKGKWFIIDN